MARSRSPAPPREVGAAPRGRGRPPIISSEQLLEIAREVFLERGIRATTAEVAARAGIAEGTIFHRFGSKDALFRAAMRFDPEQVPKFVELMTERTASADIRTRLVDFASQMLQVGRIAVPVMMMSWSNPAGDYSLEKMLGRAEGYRRALMAVSRFFETEIRAGRLAAKNPELLARIFMGSLHHYCMTELMLGEEANRHLSPPIFAEGLADVVLRAAGHVPKPIRAHKKPRARRARF